jgi:two-component system nitrogen regulation response regulator NtrX
MHKILIVDDQADIREILADILEDEGYEVLQASNASNALKKFEEMRPSLVILDIWLEGSDMDGIGILKRFKSFSPNIPVIMISGHGNIETAVQTIKLGAYDFIEKPFKAEKLTLLLKRALELSSLKEEIKDLKAGKELQEMVGKSKSISQVGEAAKLASASNSRVLISGETGTGKEIVARMIHYLSPRKDMPYIIMHAQKLKPEEIEAELFGIDDGKSFKLGKLERANGGTLYIDEISNLPPECQAKLLKFLQESAFYRVGNQNAVKADIRIICSSSHELSNSEFNQSLFYRLNVVPIHIPALRERKDDLGDIIEDIAAQLEATLNLPKPIFSAEAFAHLQAYSWPGNIRQLKNMLEWLMLLKGRNEGEITLADLPKDISGNSEVMPSLHQEIILKPLKPARELFEKEYINAQLSRFSGNISKTADFIGMDRTTLHRKLKSLKIANE